MCTELCRTFSVQCATDVECLHHVCATAVQVTVHAYQLFSVMWHPAPLQCLQESLLGIAEHALSAAGD